MVSKSQERGRTSVNLCLAHLIDLTEWAMLLPSSLVKRALFWFVCSKLGVLFTKLGNFIFV